MRRTARALAAGLALAIGTSGWAHAQGTDGARPFCDFPGTYTDWSDLTYKGVRMVMPTAYERHERRVRDGQSVDGIGGHYIAVWIIDFRPALSQDVRGRAADPTWLRFLINEMKPIGEIAKNNVALNAGNRTGFADRPPLSSYPSVPGPYGLTEIAYDGTIAEREAEGPLRGFRALATYADFDPDGAVNLIVECKHEDVRVQLCEQFFEVEPFTITMTFKRSKLADWDRFRRDTERLIACATELGERAKAGERL